MARLIPALLLVLQFAAASPLHAATTLRLAATDTLAAFGEAMQVALDAVAPHDVPAVLLQGATARLRRVQRAADAAPPVDAFSLARAFGSAEHMRVLGGSAGWLAQDVDSLLWFYGSYLEDPIAEWPDTALRDGIESRVQQVRHALLLRAQEEGLARLRRYEIKYGPGSPRLNVAEVLLNAGLQRLSLFGPGPRGPSPWEALLAYSTSYVTVDDHGEAKAVSVLEAGLRRYTFGWAPQETRLWLRLLRPRYGSAGVAMAEARDGALRWPLRGASEKSTRVGPFLTWGDYKVAVLLGGESRWLVSRQVHLLPNLF
jgi:hypothetical protein